MEAGKLVERIEMVVGIIGKEDRVLVDINITIITVNDNKNLHKVLLITHSIN